MDASRRWECLADHRIHSLALPLFQLGDVCGKDFDPVMVCSECGDPLSPRQVHVHPGPGAKDARHLPMQTDLPGARHIAKEKAVS
jgi:hypothetical protein